MESVQAPHYSRRRKILISAFIVFHLGCVLAWVMPKPSPLKSFLLGLKLPLPSYSRNGAEKEPRWKVEPREVIPTYLYNTSQYQGWSMFAPVPVPVPARVTATTNEPSGAQSIHAGAPGRSRSSCTSRALASRT